MSLPEDYRPCQNCGTLTDSGVCSADCANDLDCQAQHDLEQERIARGECPECGETLAPETACANCND